MTETDKNIFHVTVSPDAAPNPDRSSLFSQFMLDVQASTRRVPGIMPENVLIGSIEFLANGNLWQHISDTGWVVIIEPPAGAGSFFDWSAMAEFTVELLYPIPADRTYDFIGATNMLAKIIAGWARWTEAEIPGSAPGPSNPKSQWSRGKNRSPLKFKFERPSIRTHEKKFGRYLECESFIVSTKIVLSIPFISDQVAFPCELPPVIGPCRNPV